MIPPTCGLVERLDRVLQELDAVCANSSGDEQQDLVEVAKTAVAKLRSIMKRSQVEQVAQLVQTKEWDKATEQMQRYFPTGVSIGLVEEVLSQVSIANNVDNLRSAIKWTDKLDVQLRPRAYEAIYEHFESKQRLANQPDQVLVLRLILKSKPAGVLDSVRAQLDIEFCKIVERIVEGVKKKDYSLSLKICEVEKSDRRQLLVLNEIITAVVSKFETQLNLENTLLLIEFSTKLRNVSCQCFMIDSLLKAFKGHDLLSSEQAMHLWAHVKHTVEEGRSWKNVPPDNRNLCTDALDKLNNYKSKYLQHYQKYVDDQDKKKIKRLHEKNSRLRSILSEFVTWYYKPDDLTRVHTLICSARAIDDYPVIESVFTRLHVEMQKSKQMNIFEPYRFFKHLKFYMSSKGYKDLGPTDKKSLEQLKAKAPACLRLLLWSEGIEPRQLRLVNKFYDSPLCVQKDGVFCFSSPEVDEQVCSATVDNETVLTSFSFKCGDTELKLDASATEADVVKMMPSGTRWKIRPVDEHHVKICTTDGKFLIADEPWQNDKSKRVVSLKRENSTDMQLWKLVLVKKIKLED